VKRDASPLQVSDLHPVRIVCSRLLERSHWTLDYSRPTHDSARISLSRFSTNICDFREWICTRASLSFGSSNTTGSWLSAGGHHENSSHWVRIISLEASCGARQHIFTHWRSAALCALQCTFRGRRQASPMLERQRSALLLLPRSRRSWIGEGPRACQVADHAPTIRFMISGARLLQCAPLAPFAGRANSLLTLRSFA
jgi:hypothetical protein